MAGIDLMAFAEGENLANERNWKDTFNDIRARTDEENLKQNTAKFDLNYPVASEMANNDYGRLGADRQVGEAQAGWMRELSNLAPEDQPTFLADKIQNYMRTLPEGSPLAVHTMNRLNEMGQQQAAAYLKAGNMEAAQTILRALPGVPQAAASQMTDIEKWSNPLTAFDVNNVMAAGGTPMGNGRVRIGNTVMTGPEFANMMVNRAKERLYNSNPYMQAINDKTKAEALASQSMALRLGGGGNAANVASSNALAAALRERGVDVFVDQRTGQVVELPAMPKDRRDLLNNPSTSGVFLPAQYGTSLSPQSSVMPGGGATPSTPPNWLSNAPPENPPPAAVTPYNSNWLSNIRPLL